MPAVSQKQQKFMGIVHGLQKGTVDPSKVSGKAKDVAKHIGKKAATDFASTKHKGLPKKVKKEGIENEVGPIHIVRKPYPGCTQAGMVYELNPLEGLHPHGLATEDIHGMYNDEARAHQVCEGLYEDWQEGLRKVEEKKGQAVEKAKKVIDQLEKQRKQHLDMAKSDPSNASSHKEKIAVLAHKIDDLMSKMEKIEKAKKPVADKKDDKKED